MTLFLSRVCVSQPRRLASLLLLAGAFAPLSRAEQQFIQPTQDELAMTSLPGYPGVAAVVLNKDEVTKDDLHSAIHYERIKILTEDGKKYANVELPYFSTTYQSKFGPEDMTQDTIQGRTIHPDGTIVPFTGKPYMKVIEKTKGIKVSAKVFTLPDVTVGSIIEYRYATRIDDMHYRSPTWIIQGDLYVKSAHYMWYPTNHELVDGATENTIHSISWFPILPKDAQITHHEIPGMGAGGRTQLTYELSVKDIPPRADEEFMPPIQNFGYRVYFNYIADSNGTEYWKSHGKYWSKQINSFTNPNSDLKDATQKIIAGAGTQDQKLRAIYAAVQKFENTSFTREHDANEDKAEGFGKLNNTDDVFKRERGTPGQLTQLFIAMARAAGMNADAMLVPDRSRDIFVQQWLDIDQFDDLIAVVNVDGKDQFFDPGSRYCPYGHLAWQHTFVTGLRQKGGATAFEETPGDGYKSNQVVRVANLKIDDTGKMTGKIDLAYTGAPALGIRHTALRGDDESLKHALRTRLEAMIPKSLEIKDVTINNLTDYENQLKITYMVEGSVGTWTGKRLVLPADLFLSNETATFPHEKRELPVDFNYPRQVIDAVRITFPSTFTMEASPTKASYIMEKSAGYDMTVESSPTYFTTRRQYAFADVFVTPDQYPQLRTFYSKFETNDQQSVVLKSTAAPTTTASNTPGGN